MTTTEMVRQAIRNFGDGRIWISDIIKKTDLPPTQVHAVLRNMLYDDEVVLIGCDFPPDLTKDRLAATMTVSGVARHIVYKR